MKYMKLGSTPDAFQADGNNIRYVATELATDIVLIVGDVKFFLHKFPLLSKSSLLKRLIATTTTNDYSVDEIHISDIPGGPSAFEICAKFCYGMIVTLNAYNVVAARCAAEYLEMHETVEKSNLIYKIEVFLNSSILRSWKDSIIVLQSTKSLLPWSEDIKVINHCVESIASKACIDTLEVEWSYTYNRKKLLPSEDALGLHWNGLRKQQQVPKDWWVEDLCELEIECYKRVIMAIKKKGRMPGEVLGETLKAYAHKRLPGFAKGSFGGDVVKCRTLVETIVWLLPSSRGLVSCGFLIRLLRASMFLDCSEMSKIELVKRIGRQLEEASAVDLLVLSSRQGSALLYDIDTVRGLVEEFIAQVSERDNEIPHEISEELHEEVQNPVFISSSNVKLAAVARLLDTYLAEVAKDPNLPLAKFVELTQMVPVSVRPVHDSLYRCIDMYLKEHPDLSKAEKKKICSLLDCKKLSADACMHAVQNDRLPLRMVVQVLFFEQRRSLGGPSLLPRSIHSLPRENGGSCRSSRSRAATSTEEDWDPVGSLKSIKLVGRGGGSERSSGSSDINGGGEDGKNDDNNNVKGKGLKLPKNILGKLWAGKGQDGDRNSSSSEASEGPLSFNLEGNKSTPLRSSRRSVS